MKEQGAEKEGGRDGGLVVHGAVGKVDGERSSEKCKSFCLRSPVVSKRANKGVCFLKKMVHRYLKKQLSLDTGVQLFTAVTNSAS